MAGRIVELAERMLGLVRVLPAISNHEFRQKVDEIKSAEEGVDGAFEASATEIMDLEVFPVNPDYFLEIAKQLDRVSDLIERTSLLLEGRRGMESEESELLESAASQIQQIAQDTATCVAELGKDRATVEQTCEVIAQRERVVDQISDHYSRLSSRIGYDVEKRMWLKEILGNMDAIADIARDLTITLRVISNKLEKQSRLDVKKGILR